MDNLEIVKDIAALKESTKSAHKRIDENDQIAKGIHQLASNVELLALQVKSLTERLDKSILKLEDSIKTQGERIGELEKKPAKQWEKVVAQIISLIVAAVFGVIVSKFI